MLSITVDTPSFFSYMTELQEKQLPFAISKGINAVAIDFQKAQRDHDRDIFTIRRAAWADRAIKIEHFATKAEPWAEIAVDPQGDKSGTGELLGKFEDQTEKIAYGSHGVAVPIDARRTKSDIVQRSQYPRNLHLHREGSRIVGDNGTYIVRLADGRELLLQRKDLGKRAAKKAGRGTHERATLLFIFEPRGVKIRPDLHFLDTAQRVVNEQWDARFAEAWDLAVATAR